MELAEFLERPYGSRSLVTFVAEEDEEDSNGRNRAIQAVANDVVTDYPLLIRGLSFYLAQKAVEQLKKAWENDIAITPIPRDWSAEPTLPPGHPRDDILYAAHPVDAHTYIPVADFHRFTFEHKFAEAVRILMHLGAKTIKVKRERGWGRDFSSKVSAGIPEAGGDAEGGAEASQGTSEQLLYEAEFAGSDNPSLAPDLVWYPHEPTWKSIVEGRMEFGLKTFSMKVHYNADFGANAELSVDAASSGFGVGGQFEKHESTVRSIDGKFAPI